MDIKEVEKAISALERGNTDYATCGKLATLYIVRDHMTQEQKGSRYSYAPGPEESEFLTTALKKEPAAVLRILDEHFETIKALYPREYKTIIRRIERI